MEEKTLLATVVEPESFITDTRVDRILDAVRNHLKVDIAFVSRYVEDDQREFTHISTDLPLPHKPGFREPKEDSFCWHILEGRLPELIRDAQQIPFAKTLPITDILPVGVHLNVPLRLSDGSVYGSFCCVGREADPSVTERDMGVLKSFAALAVEQIESNLEDDTRQSVLRAKVEKIIDSDRLTILHQPIHSLADNRPAGVECLARFPDADERGPDKWFEEAEQAGLGVKLELLAIRSALATLPYVPAGHYMSINASPETIISGALEEALSGTDRDRLVIEVTEHQEVKCFQELSRALNRIRPKARIAIDDVGAGYAGLRHIVDLEPDILKLDMSLTRDIDTNPARRALAAAMVVFSREIGSTLVAEGIETAEERDVLADLGVTYGQGYFYSRPLPVVASQQWLLQTDNDCDGSGETPAPRKVDLVKSPNIGAHKRSA